MKRFSYIVLNKSHHDKMKRTIIFFFFFTAMLTSFSQGAIDAMLPKIAAEKDDNKRIDIINNFFSNTAESDPLLDLKNGQKLLLYEQQHGDKIGEALALGFIGYDYRAFGNNSKSLEYDLKAEKIADENGNEKLIANTMMVLSHNYKDLANYPKAL